MKHYYESISGFFDFQDVYEEQVKLARDGHTFLEIGTYRGKSAAFLAVEIINSGKCILLDVVDPWDGRDCPGLLPGGANEDPDISSSGSTFEVFSKNIEPVAHLIHVNSMTSLQASLLYDDESLDFIFIDGAHDYDNVIQDMKIWWEKLKPGCVLAGHDFPAPGVKRAVLEFSETHGIEITPCSKRSWISEPKK